MEVFVCAPCFRWTQTYLTVSAGSVAGDVVDRVIQQTGVSSSDFFITCNGRLLDLEDPLQHEAVYHLEPRLRGGKGGFGSMLRALGAQIEKTTNREACRDLSGRRLRDVNHEKEMAEWLKKQSEREAEKEQRRLERLQRKLSEPKHQFTDTEYQQQCHDLSERLEDSVLKGLQASSSSQVKVCDALKRPNPDQSKQPHTKKKKTTTAACLWMGVDELLSSEEEEESPSTSSRGAAVTMTTQTNDSSSASSSCSEDQSSEPSAGPAETTSAGPAETTSAGPAETTSAGPAETTSAGPAETTSAGPAETTSADPTYSSCPLLDSQSEQRLPLDLQVVQSAGQLEALGLDILKEELMCRGLKCGGTLAERAARLFAVRGLKVEQIDPALLAKPGKAKRK